MDHFFSIYKVTSGDTLTSIAKAHNWRSAEALIQFRKNKSLIDPNKIYPGQSIFIPAQKIWLQSAIVRNQKIMAEALATLNDFNSTKNNIVRAVFKAWDQIGNAVTMKDTASTTFKYAKLNRQIGNLSNGALSLAKNLQSIRATGLLKTCLDTLLKNINEINVYLEKAKVSLKMNDAAIAAKYCKIALRHLGKIQNIRKLVMIKDVRDPKTLMGAVGKTIDIALIAFDLGFYAGEFMAACSPKAEFGLFVLGFEEYDKEVGQELEKAMMKTVEMAQWDLSNMRMQLSSPVYKFS